jgi:sulfur carrier protein ThiS
VPAGLTVEQTLRRLEVPAAGDLLAVDHSVLRKGAYPPRVLVNGQPAPPTRRLHRGDRVTVARGRTRIEPVTRVTQLLAASRPGNPMRSLPTVWVPVMSVTSCDLRILMDQPTESISS